MEDAQNDVQNDKTTFPAEEQQAKPDMAELMLRLAEIRRATPDTDDTNRRLVKYSLVLLGFLLVIIFLPVFFTGSCNPPR